MLVLVVIARENFDSDHFELFNFPLRIRSIAYCCILLIFNCACKAEIYTFSNELELIPHVNVVSYYFIPNMFYLIHTYILEELDCSMSHWTDML